MTHLIVVLIIVVLIALTGALLWMEGLMTAPTPLTMEQAQASYRAAFPHDPDQPCTCSGYPNCPITQIKTCTGHLVGCVCDLDFAAYNDLVTQIYKQGGFP